VPTPDLPIVPRVRVRKDATQRIWWEQRSRLCVHAVRGCLFLAGWRAIDVEFVTRCRGTHTARGKGLPGFDRARARGSKKNKAALSARHAAPCVRRFVYFFVLPRPRRETCMPNPTTTFRRCGYGRKRRRRSDACQGHAVSPLTAAGLGCEYVLV